MKQIFLFACLALLLCAFTPARATVLSLPVTSHAVPGEPEPAASPFAGMTVKEFLDLSPKDYRKLTGKKMNLVEKISFKLAQRKVRKMVRKNKDVDMASVSAAMQSSDFNIVGFVLGFLLGLIGVLIAYIVNDTTMIKWAWIGCLIWIGIFLLAVIL